VYSLFPFPKEELLGVLRPFKKIIVPELNTGQYVKEIERVATQGQEVISITRVDGKLLTPQQIIQQGGLL
jgi:2-oxoglutarate ferredoxin oxidoreductase subunit alpha